MPNIQPHNLSTAELVRYAHLAGADKLPQVWVEELIKRLEQTLDDNR